MKTKMMYLLSIFIGCCIAGKAQTINMGISDSLPQNVEVDKSSLIPPIVRTAQM